MKHVQKYNNPLTYVTVGALFLLVMLATGNRSILSSMAHWTARFGLIVIFLIMAIGILNDE